jgi:hypothetical protein
MGYQAAATRCAVRYCLFLLPLLAGLAGCVGSPSEGPLEAWRNLTGDPLQGRPPPPGADLPYPNLASVPPAPPRGATSTREELSGALADFRNQSQQPLPRDQPLPPVPEGTESAGIVPVLPPLAPRLAAAPAIRANDPNLPRADGAPGAPALPADPGNAPALPPAEMLAPAPPPADMMAPAPPRL